MIILLIDDHDIFRDGMQFVLTKLDNNVTILNAGSYEEALPLIKKTQDLDLVLLDLGLPGLSDMAVIEAVRCELPSTPLVILSTDKDADKVQQALSLGAQGYIPKNTNAEVLISSLKLVLSGGLYIPPEILTRLENKSNYHEKQLNKAIDTPLTARQLEVLEELVFGCSNKEISIKLQIAEATVRAHIATILKTLNADNRSRAVHTALQKGWVSIEQ